MVTFVEEATIEKDSFQPFVILYLNDKHPELYSKKWKANKISY